MATDERSSTEHEPPPRKPGAAGYSRWVIGEGRAAMAQVARPSDRTVERVVRWMMVLVTVVANLGGVAVVVVMAVWVLPLREQGGDPSLAANLAIAAVWVTMLTVVATTVMTRRLLPGRIWLKEQRPPTLGEQRSLLRAPLTIFFGVAAGWSLSALLFGLFNALAYSVELGVRIGTTIAFAGLTTCAIAYLLAERMLRPAAARALAARPLEQPVLPGVAARTLFAWGLGSALPVVGLLTIGLSAMIEKDFTRDQLALAVLVLCLLAVTAGFLTTLIVARIIADPVAALRKAIAQVESGDLDAEVPVYDGTEIGMLQTGFNRMVLGLQERERIRELFGHHVGQDVAREALEREVELGGEVRTVSVLFIDVIGSTTLATERPPTDVVELLNRFFGIVIDTVDEHGGWVNKFEGDAALAIFGAPTEVADGPSRALATARNLVARLSSIDGLEAAVGVATGEAVAGNVGGRERYEYTVIGDPVNQAARLSELAKETPGRVLAAMSSVGAATPGEASKWEQGEGVVLRGRSEPTALAVPKR